MLVTLLADSVESLKRAIAIAGTFATLYPNTTTADLEATLADGAAEAQLDGWFPDSTVDATAFTVVPDLSQAESRLIIIYAACQMVQAQLLNLKNRKSYQAGSAKAETEQSVTLLTEILKGWLARRQDLLERARETSVSAAFVVADQYFARAVGSNDAAFYDLSEYPNFTVTGSL